MNTPPPSDVFQFCVGLVEHRARRGNDVIRPRRRSEKTQQPSRLTARLPPTRAAVFRQQSIPPRRGEAQYADVPPLHEEQIAPRQSGPPASLLLLWSSSLDVGIA